MGGASMLAHLVQDFLIVATDRLPLALFEPRILTAECALLMIRRVGFRIV